jgi:hypothetical protein
MEFNVPSCLCVWQLHSLPLSPLNSFSGECGTSSYSLLLSVWLVFVDADNWWMLPMLTVATLYCFCCFSNSVRACRRRRRLYLNHPGNRDRGAQRQVPPRFNLKFLPSTLSIVLLFHSPSRSETLPTYWYQPVSLNTTARRSCCVRLDRTVRSYDVVKRAFDNFGRPGFSSTNEKDGDIFAHFNCTIGSFHVPLTVNWYNTVNMVIVKLSRVPHKKHDIMELWNEAHITVASPFPVGRSCLLYCHYHAIQQLLLLLLLLFSGGSFFPSTGSARTP